MKQSFIVFSEMEFLYFVNFLCWTCRRLSCTVTLKPPQIYQLRFVDISINYSKQNKTKHKSHLLQKFKCLTSETNKQTKTNIQQRKKKNKQQKVEERENYHSHLNYMEWSRGKKCHYETNNETTFPDAFLSPLILDDFD